MSKATEMRELWKYYQSIRELVLSTYVGPRSQLRLYTNWYEEMEDRYG